MEIRDKYLETCTPIWNPLNIDQTFTQLKVFFLMIDSGWSSIAPELFFCIKPAHRHRKAAHEPNLQSRPGLTEGRFFLLSGICRSGQFFLIICTAGSTGFVIRLQQGFVVDLQAGSTLHYLQRSFRSLLAHRDKKERPNGIELAVHSMQSEDIKKREQI